MVIPVHDINKFFCPLTFSHRMKSKTMHEIFKKSPEKHTRNKYPEDGSVPDIKPEMTEI
jgi:hypothetical protein